MTAEVSRSSETAQDDQAWRELPPSKVRWVSFTSASYRRTRTVEVDARSETRLDYFDYTHALRTIGLVLWPRVRISRRSVDAVTYLSGSLDGDIYRSK